MPAVYTEVQLKRMHSLKQAIPGQLYKSESGSLYTGTLEGFLKRELKLEGDTEGTSLNNTIEQVGTYTTKELMTKLGTIDDKVDIVDFEEYKLKAKCFAIAMATAL